MLLRDKFGTPLGHKPQKPPKVVLHSVKGMSPLVGWMEQAAKRTKARGGGPW